MRKRQASARNYAKEYRDYHGTEEQKKRRAKRNTARRRMESAGKVHKGDGKDVHHTDRQNLSNAPSKLKVTNRSKNRGWTKGR